MPYRIIHKLEEKRPYKIVNAETGKVVGSSASEEKAKASIRARMANENTNPTVKEVEAGIFTDDYKMNLKKRGKKI